MEKGLTSYVLNYLLSTCFDSKADMARQLDMSKRAERGEDPMTAVAEEVRF